MLISICPWLGECWGTHLHPLLPLPGVLPGDQEADGQIGPPGASPPAVVRPRVLQPSPLLLVLPTAPYSPGHGLEWGAARYPWNNPPFSFLLGGHGHLTISGQTGITFSDPPFPPPLPKDNLQQQIPHCQAASQQGKGPGQAPGGVSDGGCGMWEVGWRMWDAGGGMQDVGYGLQDETCEDMGWAMEGSGMYGESL